MSTTIEGTPSSRTEPVTAEPWRGFRGQGWREAIDVRQFLQDNYTPYDGDDAFLTGPTARTTGVWAKLTALFPRERERGVLDVDNHIPSSITAHPPGYIDRDAELIVGLQTDAPLRRAIMPTAAGGSWRPGWRPTATRSTRG